MKSIFSMGSISNCPCDNCIDRGSIVCDHSVKCPNGYAKWKFYNDLLSTLNRYERDKELSSMRIDIEKDKRLKKYYKNKK